MCGIGGILGRDDAPLGRRMADRLRHRGPDGAGTWTDARQDAAVTLFHRRLAILDLPGGAQPMQDASGRFVIAYNGELYNHRALRVELETRGARFRTHSDTEVLLEAWRAWGPAALDRCEGMYAFVLWDTHESRLHLGRDPWGVKPLHWCAVAGSLLVASEMKAFLGHPEFVPAPDEEAFRQNAVFEFVPRPRTRLAGVHTVPPGAVVTFHASEPTRPAAIRTTQPPGTLRPSTPEHAVEMVANALRASVDGQRQADVQVGVVLSGGLDSATVATLMAQAGGEPVQTFTAAGSEDLPDARAAAELARILGTRHTQRILDPDALLAALPQHIWHNEATDYSEMFFWGAFEATATSVKVALCGQGADELWGGYERYRNPASLAQTRCARLAAVGSSEGEAVGASTTRTHRDGATLAAADQGAQLEDFQLRLVDRTAMAHGLEVRVPMLDGGLHALSRGTPWAWKLRGEEEKWVLRQAALRLGVPPAIANRRKAPAGRATAPGAVTAFEERARSSVDPARMARHPLAHAFASPAQYLAHRIWEEVMLHGASAKTLDAWSLA